MNITVNLQLNNTTMLPEKVVEALAKMRGPSTIYCWYVGPVGLPETGATFMTDSIIRPLIEKKKDATFCLYSLEEWSFKRVVSKMTDDTEMTSAIKRVDNAAIECLSSASFFQFCRESKTDFPFVKNELLKISETVDSIGITVDELYEGRSTLLDCIKAKDVMQAYSCMQYLEGYYLVRRLALKAIEEGQKRAQVAFVLPGGEGKYYRSFKEDLPIYLKKDLGENTLDLTVSFLFFKYCINGETRPYLTKTSPYVQPSEVASYLVGGPK